MSFVAEFNRYHFLECCCKCDTYCVLITSTFLHCTFWLFNFISSIQIQMADEFEQDLIKSIETLLEETTTNLVEHIREGEVSDTNDVWPTVMPKFIKGNSLLIDGQHYVKWSTVDSDERIRSKRTQIPATIRHNAVATAVATAASSVRPSPTLQQSTIAAAMYHRQVILNQYLLHQYNMTQTGQMPNFVDRLIYAMNPAYAEIGYRLAASTALNWNTAATASRLKLQNQLNGLMSMLAERELRTGKYHLKNVAKKQWIQSATTNN